MHDIKPSVIFSCRNANLSQTCLDLQRLLWRGNLSAPCPRKRNHWIQLTQCIGLFTLKTTLLIFWKKQSFFLFVKMLSKEYSTLSWFCHHWKWLPYLRRQIEAAWLSFADTGKREFGLLWGPSKINCCCACVGDAQGWRCLLTHIALQEYALWMQA